MNLCEYGCGQEARFILKNGKLCCSKSQNSCLWIREKFRNSKVGIKHPEHSKRLKGRIISEKCKEVNKKRLLSGESIYLNSLPRSLEKMKIRSKKLSIYMTENNPMSNLKYRKKISGENCYLWKGGISSEPYGTGFTKELQKLIRRKFNNSCILCRRFARITHHIDYNKRNNLEDNFVLLCRKCHSKTNTKRDQWELTFKTFLNSFDTRLTQIPDVRI